MMNRLILTACLTLLGAGTVNANRSFQNGIKKEAVVIPDTEKIVSIRGGAGPIEPATAAKLIGAMYTVQGAVGTLSPTSNNEAYGVKTLVPVTSSFRERLHIASLNMASSYPVFLSRARVSIQQLV
eukprot:scaffold123542_cov53-Attheya_sp.AAC.3